MKRFYLGLLSCFLMFSCGLGECDSESRINRKNSSFSIVNWNVQTFFDGHTEGTEYKDFKSAGKWSNDKYYTRLTRLCEVLSTLNADFYVLEEIENENIIHDISNQFAGKSWNSASNWTYSCFAKEKDSSIGCAVLSKFPLFGVKTHSIDIRTQKSAQPSVRPLIEVCADINGREVTLFVNHWKSKSGGEETSKIWRDWQEAVLAQRIAELKARGGTSIICGDFNRNADEFILDFSTSENTLLRYINIKTGNKEVVKVHSPWFNSDGTYVSQTGSYYYKDNWERIDHIFCTGNARISTFGPRAQNPWANENKTPFYYKIYSGTGYSDHLPVMANVILH
ncbi:MAG: endonuclease/exonuclease/phosphatase family protein [Treponema sp.]|nr:endonuclease/exonuclease/phosphatase family protein [Treponema sp.]